MRWAPHTTVAAIVEKDGRFLTVKELVKGQIVYNQPAGHLENNENLIEAVIRETLEETGWHFLPAGITGIYHWSQPQSNESFIRFSFYGTCTGQDTKKVLDDPILEALWLTTEELKQENIVLRSPMVLKSIDDYLQGNHFSLELLTNIF